MRCYAGTDVNGSAHIDYSFAATVRGPLSHDLFACEARNCLHDVLELVIDAVPQSRLVIHAPDNIASDADRLIGELAAQTANPPVATQPVIGHALSARG